MSTYADNVNGDCFGKKPTVVWSADTAIEACLWFKHREVGDNQPGLQTERKRYTDSG